MKLDRRDNVRYVHNSEKMRSNNLIKYYQELVGEFETDYLEVVSRKRSVIDKIPGKLTIFVLFFNYLTYYLVIYNFFILANSKLHILKCVDMLIRNLDTTAFRLCYMDTGVHMTLKL